MKKYIKIIIIAIILILTIFTLSAKATEIPTMYTGLLKAFMLYASETSEEIEDEIVLVPEITMGEPVLEYQNMPLNVIQIITVPVTTENIEENAELSIRLVKDGMDLPESYYTVSGNTINSEGTANIQIFAGPEITLGDYILVIEYTYGENEEQVQARKEFTISNIEINQIIINQSAIVIDVDEKTKITYNIVPSGFTDDDLLFISENEEVATITPGGEITAIGRGDTNVKITSKDGKVQAACPVVVLEPTVNILEITTTPEELQQGEDGTINVKISIKDILIGESLDVKIYKDGSIVTENFTIEGNLVQGNEVNLVITPNKEIVTSGEYEIETTYEGKRIEEEGIQQTIAFTVRGAIPVTELVSEEEDRIYIKEKAKRQINATVLPENATNKKLMWISSNPEVATVNEQGLVEAKSKGITQITVYSDENPYFTRTIEIRVIDLVATEEYAVDIQNKIIKHIPVNTTVNSLLENLQIAADNYSVINKNNETITGETLVGTDSQLKVEDETFKIVVNGDINGDGKLTSTDISKLALHIVKLQILTDGPLLGADLNKDDKISTTDISQMIKYIVKIYD